jgi:hypothetical protein
VIFTIIIDRQFRQIAHVTQESAAEVELSEARPAIADLLVSDDDADDYDFQYRADLPRVAELS